MKQISLNKYAYQLVFLITGGLFLSGCTSPTTGGNNLNNQPDTTAIITQTQLAVSPTTPMNGNGSAAANQNVVKPNTPAMKQLSDFPPNKATKAVLSTTKGDITISLFRDEAPLTTLNFITLASSSFYDGIVFHRIIPGFMAQVGDPISKDPAQKSRWGTGGPGYSIADEFGPGLKHDKAGVVSMANSGPNTGGSQFFITHEETPWLDGKHAIFGQVTEGMEVVMQLEVGDSITKITLQ